MLEQHGLGKDGPVARVVRGQMEELGEEPRVTNLLASVCTNFFRNAMSQVGDVGENSGDD